MLAGRRPAQLDLVPARTQRVNDGVRSRAGFVASDAELHAGIIANESAAFPRRGAIG